tara:strand:- start:285 stop:1145 length:861 start_codon:yes stop_codon:yes gene_type:complete
MGKELAEQLPQVRHLYDQAAEILGYDLASLCFEGPEDQLNATEYSQPALFVTSLAALESLRQSEPDLVAACGATAGLSLGEYTSLVFAGVMDFEDSLKVVQQRGIAMQAASDAVPSGMVSILGLEEEDVQRLCANCRQDNEILQPANFLCPGNLVVSGHLEACNRIVPMAAEEGAIRSVPLSVAGAFHTPLMEDAVEKLAAALAEVSLKQPRIPVISNVDAQQHNDPEEIRDLLIKQVVSPVRWEASMRQLLADGFDQYYEIGPGRTMRGLLRRIDKKIKCENITC